MKIRVIRRKHFSASHLYHQKAWNELTNKEVFGACFSKYGHGHNYVLEVTYEGAVDPMTGMIANLTWIDAELAKLVETLDFKHLNYDVPEFKDMIPTTENLAIHCYNYLKMSLSKDSNQVMAGAMPSKSPLTKNNQTNWPIPIIKKVRVYENADLFAEVED